MPTQNPSTARIAALNDRCRQGLDPTARRTQTSGIAALPVVEQLAILAKIATFTDFSSEDDAYDERDFGAFTHKEERILWKIDYYDLWLEYGSDDPSDPAKNVRVLTIMLAHEY